MKGRTIRYISICCLFLVVAMRLLRDIFSDADSFCFMDGVIIAVPTITAILLLWISYTVLSDIRDSNKAFDEMWSKNNFSGCISFAESELKKDIAKGFALNAKSNLVMAYYRIGDNEAGKKLLRSTKWGNYKDGVLYFFVLDSLAAGDLSEAQRYYRQLCRSATKRKRQQQIEFCRQLLGNTATQAKAETPAIQSIYPIVGEILRQHRITGL